MAIVADIPQIPIVPLTHECIIETAARFDMPAQLIYSILKVEGGQVGLKNKNTNGTYDLGPMQINTIWIDTFKPYVTPEQILYNGCINVQVGAWILKSRINESGDFWEGVGGYHSKTPSLNETYQQKVYRASQILNGK